VTTQTGTTGIPRKTGLVDRPQDDPILKLNDHDRRLWALENNNRQLLSDRLTVPDGSVAVSHFAEPLLIRYVSEFHELSITTNFAGASDSVGTFHLHRPLLGETYLSGVSIGTVTVPAGQQFGYLGIAGRDVGHHEIITCSIDSFSGDQGSFIFGVYYFRL
jgi:hypothetical protein